MAAALKSQFGFDDEHVCLLTDEQATRECIFKQFMAFTSHDVHADDRIMFFFAGHGFTRVGARSEIGFLVPVDGNVDDLNTLIPWRQLIESAELIPAKHLLFVIDACYGGLALKRYLKPGGARFVRDMLLRYGRQTIAAGKADETVSDADGPLKGHSIFTGHFLQGMEGAAAPQGGILTANSLMAYTYSQVSQDYNSHQTPHYGFVDGDGDLIFDRSAIDELDADQTRDKDVLVTVSLAHSDQKEEEFTDALADQLEEYISDPKYRIKLDGLVKRETQRCIEAISDKHFSFQPEAVTGDDVAERLNQYDRATDRLMTVSILLAKWASAEQRDALRLVFSRLPDAHTEAGGLVAWLALRWYPVTRLIYASGVAAVSAEKYDNLAAILKSPVSFKYGKSQPVIQPAVEEMTNVAQAGLFKRLPTHERHFAPESEYFFKNIQPAIDDSLFLGREYEDQFDRFEVLYALITADLYVQEGRRVWGPPGRFGWTFSRDHDGSGSFATVVRKAARLEENWPPLRAGFFGGSFKRFADIAERYKVLLGTLGWY